MTARNAPSTRAPADSRHPPTPTHGAATHRHAPHDAPSATSSETESAASTSTTASTQTARSHPQHKPSSISTRTTGSKSAPAATAYTSGDMPPRNPDSNANGAGKWSNSTHKADTSPSQGAHTSTAPSKNSKQNRERQTVTFPQHKAEKPQTRTKVF